MEGREGREQKRKLERARPFLNALLRISEVEKKVAQWMKRPWGGEGGLGGIINIWC